MKIRNPALISAVLFVITSSFLSSGAMGGVQNIDGEIQINSEWPVIPLEEEETVLLIEGSFMVTEKSGLDIPFTVTATLSLSEGRWEASLRQTEYQNVNEGEVWPFAIDMVIPQDAQVGESSSYTVTLTLKDQISETSTQASFVVRLISSDTGSGGGNSGTVPGNVTSSDGTSRAFPIWPLFVLGLVFIGVAAGVWAYRNLEVVREVDGKRRIYLREKDSGRIIGRDR
ncbi:MAG: hypothetical protein DRN37_08020 [Thermoplasmata archaeon]|nr:MAG: hypothetical protein DRN37_08020 [Thermoplasmata archaeon]HHD15475.1 hypothetical protein [Euryarchaeota archaeon]